ncbi:MAG: type IV pilus assembly protein PilM [Sedimentisphaerales bacterium]|nr:type IV pilus assembly protein PilM [Sedimentisphaerales bacterium]
MIKDWKHLFERKTDVLGLDIGSCAVKMVALHRSDTGYTTTAASITEIAPSEDDNHRRTNTVHAVRKCIESVRIKTKLVVCGVSGQEVAVRSFNFPSLLPEEISPAVSLEASQVCPFNASDSTIDYHLMPNGNDKTSGVLVAATNTLIKSKTQLAKEAHLNCILMDVDGLALLNCFNGLANGHEKTEANQTVAILNVGGTHTTLAIMDNKGWPFIRDMIYAGNDIVAQIAAENDTSKEIVRGILFGDSETVEPGLYESLAKASQKLIGDVGETLRYYTAQSASSNVEKLFVCGGFALAGGFVELLNNRLGVEAVLWNPFDKIRCNENRQLENVLAKSGPAMAVAAGLAMRSV